MTSTKCGMFLEYILLVLSQSVTLSKFNPSPLFLHSPHLKCSSIGISSSSSSSSSSMDTFGFSSCAFTFAEGLPMRTRE